MAPKPKLLISSGSKKKEPRYACLSEARASHSHRMWAEVSSLTPHFLHKGLASSPNRWRCLLRVLWPLRRSVTTLDWILFKVINFAVVPRLGPEINSRDCLWVSPRPHHWAPCWLTNLWLSLFCKSRLETPRAGSSPRNLWAMPPLTSPSAISLPHFRSIYNCLWYQLYLFVSTWKNSISFLHVLYEVKVPYLENPHLSFTSY